MEQFAKTTIRSVMHSLKMSLSRGQAEYMALAELLKDVDGNMDGPNGSMIFRIIEEQFNSADKGHEEARKKIAEELKKVADQRKKIESAEMAAGGAPTSAVPIVQEPVPEKTGGDVRPAAKKQVVKPKPFTFLQWNPMEETDRDHRDQFVPAVDGFGETAAPGHEDDHDRSFLENEDENEDQPMEHPVEAPVVAPVAEELVPEIQVAEDSENVEMEEINGKENAPASKTMPIAQPNQDEDNTHGTPAAQKDTTPDAEQDIDVLMEDTPVLPPNTIDEDCNYECLDFEDPFIDVADDLEESFLEDEGNENDDGKHSTVEKNGEETTENIAEKSTDDHECPADHSSSSTTEKSGNDDVEKNDAGKKIDECPAQKNAETTTDDHECPADKDSSPIPTQVLVNADEETAAEKNSGNSVDDNTGDDINAKSPQSPIQKDSYPAPELNGKAREAEDVNVKIPQSPVEKDSSPAPEMNGNARDAEDDVHVKSPQSPIQKDSSPAPELNGKAREAKDVNVKSPQSPVEKDSSSAPETNGNARDSGEDVIVKIPQSPVEKDSSPAPEMNGNARDAEDVNAEDTAQADQFEAPEDHEDLENVPEFANELDFLRFLNQFQRGGKQFVDTFRKHYKSFFNNQELKLDTHKSGTGKWASRGVNGVRLFKSAAGLGLKAPENASFANIEQILGSEFLKRVCVVTDSGNGMRQLKMPMMKVIEAVRKGGPQAPVWNVLSFEFSNDKELSGLFDVPTEVEKASIVDQLRKKLTEKKEDLKEKMAQGASLKGELMKVESYLKELPLYEKFLLISSSGCFTDSHIDLSGTGVYYHVLHGHKVFFVARPTKENLERYQRWETSGQQGPWILEEMVGEYKRVDIRAGETAMLPPGYPHFVFTAEDSIVVGGNYLAATENALKFQFQLTKMEKIAKTPRAQRFARFYPLHFLFIKEILLPQLREKKERYGRTNQQDSTIINILVENLQERFLEEKSWFSVEERKEMLEELMTFTSRRNLKRPATKTKRGPRVKLQKFQATPSSNEPSTSAQQDAAVEVEEEDEEKEHQSMGLDAEDNE